MSNISLQSLPHRDQILGQNMKQDVQILDQTLSRTDSFQTFL